MLESCNTNVYVQMGGKFQYPLLSNKRYKLNTIRPTFGTLFYNGLVVCSIFTWSVVM